MDFYDHVEQYWERLGRARLSVDWTRVKTLTGDLDRCRKDGSTVYIVGDGGSAANSEHVCNDLQLCGIRSEALSANSAVMTCLANDCGFDTVFMTQLELKARDGDILIALSGSGNSPNILRALEHAERAGMPSYAILGFDGGKAKGQAMCSIHAVDADQQHAEDIQHVSFHVIMQWLQTA